MARLLYWLPLISDAKNQGTTGTTFTNNNVTFGGAGKLGTSAVFGGSGFIYNTVAISVDNVWSVAWWAKASSLHSGYMFSLGTSNTASQIQMGMRTGSSTSNSFAIVINKYFQTFSIDGADYTKWNHYVLTYDGSQYILYMNGVSVRTYAYAEAVYHGARLAIGAYYSTTFFNGMIQDFRLYDNVLSPREVAEIAKGLVLHYPLSRDGFGGDNILPNTWAEERTFEYPSSSYYDRWSCVTSIVPTASQYTLSFWAKSTVAGDKIRTHFYSPNTTTTCVSSQGITKTATDGNMDFTLSTEWKHYWVTYSQNTTSAVKHIICPRMGAVGNTQGICYGTGTVSIKQIKLEEGDTPTPWIPATADTEYAAMGLNDGIEYDCSGYKHNGTKTGTFTYSSDTPKHNVSTVFNGSNHVAVGRLPITDELTYNWWGYVDDWSKTLGGAMVCSVEGGGMGHQNAGSTYLWFLCGTGTSSNSYGTGYQMPTPSSGWHMFTETWDGYSFKVYLDGQLGFTNNRYTTKTPVYYHPSYNFLFIGGESSSSATTPGDHFVGKLSDFRIYATALNADQIMELYHTGISLANNSTLLASEFVEV